MRLNKFITMGSLVSIALPASVAISCTANSFKQKPASEYKKLSELIYNSANFTMVKSSQIVEYKIVDDNNSEDHIKYVYFLLRSKDIGIAMWDDDKNEFMSEATLIHSSAAEQSLIDRWNRKSEFELIHEPSKDLIITSDGIKLKADNVEHYQNEIIKLLKSQQTLIKDEDKLYPVGTVAETRANEWHNAEYDSKVTEFEKLTPEDKEKHIPNFSNDFSGIEIKADVAHPDNLSKVSIDFIRDYSSTTFKNDGYSDKRIIIAEAARVVRMLYPAVTRFLPTTFMDVEIEVKTKNSKATTFKVSYDSLDNLFKLKLSSSDHPDFVKDINTTYIA